jgi:putative hydroxymethylpyrimidine transport system substrate-binding protein
MLRIPCLRTQGRQTRRAIMDFGSLLRHRPIMNRIRRRAKRGRPGPYLAFGAVLLSCLAVGLVGLNLQRSQSKPLPSFSPSSKEYVLKLNGAITPSSAGVVVALADGLFEREGLSVRLLSGAGDADVITSVAADDHVIGLASAAGFLKARAEGSPIVAFAASYIVSSVEFFALSNTRLLGPSDLEGKRIGYKATPEILTILRAFIARNSIAQSGLQIVESDSALSDLLNGRIDVLIGHRDIEGRSLESAKAAYRSLSPDSFGIHAMGPVYFANERAFAKPGNLEKFLIATANGWNAAYSDYGRTIPVIAHSIDEGSSPALTSRFMDTQRRLLRPFGARFGELDLRRLRILHEQLLKQRIIQQPVDLTLAVNYHILTEIYRTESNINSN